MDVFYHEDDYCLLELLPSACEGWCRREMGIIDNFAREHAAPEGNGYTDIYLRDEPRLSISDMSITVESFRHSLKGVVPEFENISTGYSSYREKCPNVRGFGLNEELAVFAEFRGNIVNSIWFSLAMYDKAYVDTAVHIMRSLSSLGSMIFVDWCWEECIKLSSTGELVRYLKHRNEEFEKY